MTATEYIEYLARQYNEDCNALSEILKRIHAKHPNAVQSAIDEVAKIDGVGEILRD